MGIYTDVHKKYKMFSLRHQVLSFVRALVIILSLLMITIMALQIRSYGKSVDNRHWESVLSYADNIENSISQLRDTVGVIYSYDGIFQGLYLYQPAVDRVASEQNMLNLLKLQIGSNRNLGGLFIYYDSDNKSLYYVNDYISFEDKEILKNTGRAVQTNNSGFLDYVVKANNDTYYNVYMPKNSTAIGGNISLSQGLTESSDETQVYGILYEDAFYQIRGEQTQLSEQELLSMQPGENRRRDCVVFLQKLKGTEISVVKIIPQNIWLYISGTHILLILLGLLLILLCMRLYRFTANQLSVPLEDMTNALQNIQGGVWEVDFSAQNRITEIEKVRQTVRMMLKELEQYKIKSYEEQLDKQKIQLQFLQLQLAPHFYTNCLKNVYYMILMKEYENAEKFLLCLSTHLRYLLQTDTTMVTVETEMGFVQNYMDMQSILSSKPLLCEMSADEAVKKMEVPILILQVFVENSIKYARGMTEEKLQIRIQVRLLTVGHKNTMDIIVCDNGPGYPEELLLALNQKELPQGEKMGVGIINLLSRLRLYYGKDISWYFDNRNGAYSEIILPVGEDV